MIDTSHIATTPTRGRTGRWADTRHRLTATAAVAAISAAAIGVTGSTVSADQPIEFADSFTFTTVNPCTDTPADITIDSVIRLHEHGDRFIAHVSRAASTNDGYVMDHGVETAVFNGNVLRQTLSDDFRNEDGSRFRAHGVIVDQGGIMRLDRLSVRCLDR